MRAKWREGYVCSAEPGEDGAVGRIGRRRYPNLAEVGFTRIDGRLILLEIKLICFIVRVLEREGVLSNVDALRGRSRVKLLSLSGC